MMKKRTILSILISTLIFGYSSIGLSQPNIESLPDLGDASREYLSLEQEQEIGRQIMRQIRRDNTYINDLIIIDYLNELGKKLNIRNYDSNRSFLFFALKDPSMNAFALPGGYIGIHTGLILNTQIESELASVVAHEIGHVTQSHLARMIANNSKVNTATLLALGLAILASNNSSSNGQVVEGATALAQGAMIQSQLNYSREHEREADRVGFDLLSKSGFDVRSMPTFFERIQKTSRLYESNAPGYLRTHPLTSERIADMQNRADASNYKQIPDNLSFQLVRNRIKALYNQHNQSQFETLKQFEYQLNQKQFNSEIAHRYGLALLYFQNNQKELLKTQIDWLKIHAPAHPYLLDLYFATDELFLSKHDLLKNYRIILKTYPDNPIIIHRYVNTLIDLKDYKTALETLDRMLQKYANQYEWLYQLKGNALSLSGNEIAGHQFYAEYYFRLDELKESIGQLNTALAIAKKTNYNNFYELSRIDARLKYFKQQDQLRENNLKKQKSNS